MHCWLNGNKIQLPKPVSITEFLNHNNINIEGVAIAINDAVVPKSLWVKEKVNENDQVLIVTAAQGG